MRFGSAASFVHNLPIELLRSDPYPTDLKGNFVEKDDTHSRRLIRMMLAQLAKLVLAGVLLLAVVAAVLLWAKQEKLLFKPTEIAPGTALSQAPDIFEVPIQVEGAVLSALHLKRPDAKGVVFFLHGNAGNLQTWFVNPTFYRAANFDLFMVDYRGYGKSTGMVESEAQLHSDVRAAYLQIARQYAGRKIVVYGRSLGSGLAAALAADLAADRLVPQPDLTVLVSSYSSMLQLTEDVYPLVPKALLRYPLRTDERIGKIASPLLMFHGDKDTLIGLSHSQRLKALAPKAELVPLPGIGHNDVQTSNLYLQQYRAALDKL